MRTRQDRLLDLIGQADTQYVIPIYQRVYSWTDRQCAELWADLMDAGAKGRMHFAGTFLCIPEPNNGNGIKQYSIVDGQQRMATTTLLLAALADYLRETGTEPEGVPAHSDISARYLHCDGAAQGGLKLLLSRGDKPALAAVIAGEAPPEGATERVGDNFRFFRGKMAEDGFDAAQLWRGLANLTVIDAELDGGDHAQLIFESLNSKGVPLVEVDLIRNYLLLTKSHAEQQRLYDEYWKPIEDMFAPDPGSLKLNNGIQGWLAIRQPTIRKKGASEVYNVFKRYASDEFDGDTEDLLDELRDFCLMWAENYKYHGVKDYRSTMAWAKKGRRKSIVSDRPLVGLGPNGEIPMWAEFRCSF